MVMNAPATSPLLYTYRRCPYAMRARMGLLLAGVAFNACEISLRSKPLGLIQASPKGTVPVLILADGTVLEQSWDILAWALNHPSTHTAQSDCAGWWDRSQTEDNLRLLALNDGEFKRLLDRYKYPERAGLTDSQHKLACQLESRQLAVTAFLQPLEARLAMDAFLGGEVACATDIGIFPMVRQFANVDTAWFQALPLPRLQAWLGTWMSSTLFAQCMHKLAPDRPEPFPMLAMDGLSPERLSVCSSCTHSRN